MIGPAARDDVEEAKAGAPEVRFLPGAKHRLGFVVEQAGGDERFLHRRAKLIQIHRGITLRNWRGEHWMPDPIQRAKRNRVARSIGVDLREPELLDGER